MRIQMVTLLAGPEGCLQPGQVADLPADRAKALIAGGFARPAPATDEAGKAEKPERAKPETATAKADETAAGSKADEKKKG